MREPSPRHGAGWRPRPERGARPGPGTPGRGGGDAPGRLPGRGSRGVGPGSGRSVSPWQRREGRGGGDGRGAGGRQGPRMSRRRGAGAAAGGALLPGRGGAGSAWARALVGVKVVGSCFPRFLPYLQRALETAPLSRASHPKPPPSLHPSAAWPYPRQLFHGETRTVDSACPVKLTTETPQKLLSALSLLCRKIEAEASLVVQHLRHSESPNPFFVPCLFHCPSNKAKTRNSEVTNEV